MVAWLAAVGVKPPSTPWDGVRDGPEVQRRGGRRDRAARGRVQAGRVEAIVRSQQRGRQDQHGLIGRQLGRVVGRRRRRHGRDAAGEASVRTGRQQGGAAVIGLGVAGSCLGRAGLARLEEGGADHGHQQGGGVDRDVAAAVRAPDQRVARHHVAHQAREVEAAGDLFIGGAGDDVLAIDAREVDHHLAVVRAIEAEPRLVLVAHAAIGADADAGADQGALDAVELGQLLLAPVSRSRRVTRRALEERKDLCGHAVDVSPRLRRAPAPMPTAYINRTRLR